MISMLTPSGRTLTRALAVLCSARGFAADIELRDVRHTVTGQVTRVAIELSGNVETRQDRLHKPERHFVDFMGARNQRRGLMTIPVGSGTLRQIRVAEAKPGVARVVLDLEGTPVISISELSNPFRVMIELKPAGYAPVPTPSEPVIVTKAVRRFELPIRKASEPRVVWLPPPPVIAFATKAGPTPLRPRLRLPAYSPRVETPKVNLPVEAATKRSSPAEAAKPSATGSTMTRALGLKLRRVMLDPGHGGHDQGSSGPTGLLEKELVLDVAKRLGELIETNLGSEVVYTREDDRFIPLETRTKLANESKADLFLSIHANSSTIRSVTGVETYYLSLTTSREAMDVAARENATSDRSVFELRDLLQKIATQDKISESREFATKVNSALYRVWPNTRNRGVKKAPFVVLIGASMPSILAEIGFLSNPKDERDMKKPEVRQRIAEALYRGVAQYADSLSHFNLAKRSSDRQTN